MDIEKTIHPFDLNKGDKYFLVYVTPTNNKICSISLEEVVSNEIGSREGKRMDVAIDYLNKPKNTPTCYYLPYNDINLNYFKEFKEKLRL